LFDDQTRRGRLALALMCVAIVAACSGIESLLDRPWVYAAWVVHDLAGLGTFVFLIGALLGPRILPMDDEPGPWDLG
jgi:hypothetical protein